MARSAVLAGRTVADLSRSIFSLAVMVGLGLLVGFRFHSSVPRILAGMAVILAFGYAFSWMYAAIGLATKDPETAQKGILPFFVLMFASNAIVPVATMPGWLQGFARNQPLSVTGSTVRALLEGGAASHWSGSRSRGPRQSSPSSSPSRSGSTETARPDPSTRTSDQPGNRRVGRSTCPSRDLLRSLLGVRQ